MGEKQKRSRFHGFVGVKCKRLWKEQYLVRGDEEVELAGLDVSEIN